MIRLAHWTLSVPILFWVGSTAPALAQAGNSIKCNDGSIVHVTTGTNGGSCSSSNGITKDCADGNNTASGGCDGGKASCGATSGSGDCSITKGKTLPPKGNRPVNAGGVYQPPTNPPPKGNSGVKPVNVGGSKQIDPSVPIERDSDMQHSSSGKH